jgi:hypothetical protein
MATPQSLAPDQYEPDDTISQAKARKATSMWVAEKHVSSGPDDVDVIPLSARSGNTYIAELSTLSGPPGDFAIAYLDETGAILIEANATPGSYSPRPKVTWTAIKDATLYIRVRRNDDSASAVSYSIEVRTP